METIGYQNKMKTLLVLAKHPSLADSVRECLNSEHYKVVHRFGIEEARYAFTKVNSESRFDHAIVSIKSR